MQLKERILLSMATFGNIAADPWVICETRGRLLERLDDGHELTIRISD
jgi:hypothetical protein